MDTTSLRVADKTRPVNEAEISEPLTHEQRKVNGGHLVTIQPVRKNLSTELLFMEKM